MEFLVFSITKAPTQNPPYLQLYTLLRVSLKEHKIKVLKTPNNMGSTILILTKSGSGACVSIVRLNQLIWTSPLQEISGLKISVHSPNFI